MHALLEMKPRVPWEGPETMEKVRLQLSTSEPDRVIALAVSSLVTTVWSAPAGASFTEATTMEAVSTAVLKAVVPPVREVSTLVPLTPEVWSQARKVIPEATVPLKSAAGWSRILLEAVEARSRAFELDTDPTFVQVVPESVEYCQFPLVESVEVMATPCTAPE